MLDWSKTVLDKKWCSIYFEAIFIQKLLVHFKNYYIEMVLN